jgi:hypothetical protein
VKYARLAATLSYNQKCHARPTSLPQAFFCCAPARSPLYFCLLWQDEGEELKDTLFGFILAGVGFGTTFLVLLIISLLCEVLKKIFPCREEDNKC